MEEKEGVYMEWEPLNLTLKGRNVFFFIEEDKRLKSIN